MNRSEDLSLGSTVVTGANGFIGRVLRERLGLSAVAFTDKDTLDVSRRFELAGHFRGFNVVVHLASPYREGPMTSARAAQSVRFARNVIEAAQRAGVARVVLLSSIRAAPIPPPGGVRSMSSTGRSSTAERATRRSVWGPQVLWRGST